MHAPESSGEITPRAPGVHEVAVQIVLDHLRRAAVEGPKISGPIHIYKVDVGGRLAHAPCVEIFAVLVKDLDAAVAAVINENASRLRIDSDAMSIIEIARPRLLTVIILMFSVQKMFAVRFG